MLMIMAGRSDPIVSRTYQSPSNRHHGSWYRHPMLLLSVLVGLTIVSTSEFFLSSSAPPLDRTMIMSQSESPTTNSNVLPTQSTTTTPKQAAAVLQLESQKVLDQLVQNGTWIRRNTTINNPLPRTALGSVSRFASCQAFLGPRMQQQLPAENLWSLEDRRFMELVRRQPYDQATFSNSNQSSTQLSSNDNNMDDMVVSSDLAKWSAPHSMFATSSGRTNNNSNDTRKNCAETDWVSRVLLDDNNNGSNNNNKATTTKTTTTILEWHTQEQVLELLRDKWIAFWGDSTNRLLFSALVHLLEGSIETWKFPTHDFGHTTHWQTFDHCLERSHCDLAIYLPHTHTMMTFRFVTKIHTWPANFSQAMQMYPQNHQVFVKHNYTDKQMPDVVFLNNGPWEFYDIVWTDAENQGPYRQNFTNFIKTNFGGGNTNDCKLVVLANSACPIQKGHCEGGGGYACVDAMAKMGSIQESIIKELDLPRVRYVPSFPSLPHGYNCIGDGYHLPGLMTDARLNLALRAIRKE